MLDDNITKQNTTTKNKEEENIKEVDFWDIIKACEGLDKNYAPNAATTLDYFEFEAPDGFVPDDKKKSLFDLMEGDPEEEPTPEEIEAVSGKIKKSIFFKNIDLKIFIRGGSAVLQADFPPESRVEYNFATEALKEYLEMDNEKKQFHEITVTVMPIIFEGQLYTIYRGLCYYNGYILPKGYSRICMVFDNSDTQWLEGKEIDYTRIKSVVNNEVLSEIAQIDHQIESEKKALEKLETEGNIFANNIKDEYNTENLYEEEIEERSQSLYERRRTTKED